MIPDPLVLALVAVLLGMVISAWYLLELLSTPATGRHRPAVRPRNYARRH